MTTNGFIWGMRLISLIAVASVISLLLFTAPYQNQDPSHKLTINIILFNASLFFALSGIFTLFLFWLRKKAAGNEVIATHLGVSFRQGMLLALSVIILLLLQSFRILAWWDGALAVGAVMMVELYFLAR